MTDRIEAHCPSCGARYRLRAEAAGRKARCKACRAVFKVPRTEPVLEEQIVRWLMEPYEEEDDFAPPARAPRPARSAQTNPPDAAKAASRPASRTGAVTPSEPATAKAS